MKKMLIVDTGWPINTRTKRFVDSLSNRFDIFIASWDRGNSNPNLDSKIFLFKSRVDYGSIIKKLILLPSFTLHVWRSLKRSNANIVFASHWDSLLSVVIADLFITGKRKIIYDCLDIPTSSTKFLLILLKFIESLCMRRVSLIILASRYFSPIYPRKIPQLIFENYPPKANNLNSKVFPGWYSSLCQNKIANSENRKILGWIGVVRYPEIIFNMLESAFSAEFDVYIFGDGPALSKVLDSYKNYIATGQLKIFGRYKHEDIPYIYRSVDVVWAAYPTKDRNAIYAISNKYFECSLYERIPIFSSLTKMASDLNNRNATVIAVNEYDVLDITSKLSLVKNEKLSCFEKYEQDQFWEDNEDRLIEAFRINNILDSE